jgi:DNA replication protein DnaC
MTELSHLHHLLKELRLKGAEAALEHALGKAEKQGLSHQGFLYELLLAEKKHKQEQSLHYRIRQAHLPFEWTLESFPFHLQPSIDKSRIMTLAGLEFVQRGDNIVFIGGTGAGKTGLAIGLLRKALIQGYRARFYKVQDLLDQLYASLADRSSSKLLKRLTNFDVLLLDELGYLTLQKEQMNMFFKLMDERYTKGKSTLITTNLAYDQWYEIFQPASMVDALLDRLKHHCVTISIEGDSLRRAEPSSL